MLQHQDLLPPILTQTLGNPEVFTYSLQERVSHMSIQTLQIVYHVINLVR